MDRETKEKRFADAVERAWKKHNLGNYRNAEDVTKVERTTLLRMRASVIPSRGKVIQWAEGIKENVNHWLQLAGYDPIPESLICEHPEEHIHEEDPIKRVTIALNGAKNLSELSKLIIDKVREELEKSKKKGD